MYNGSSVPLHSSKEAELMFLTLSLMMKFNPAAKRCRPVVGGGLRERGGDLYLGGGNLSRGGDLWANKSCTQRCVVNF